MAKPRTFLSSTFYDLRHVRGDLERFIRELGYEPVLAERGQIPYGRDGALENYCYREISNCDMVVHIVGGRFGSQSAQAPYSVSQQELRNAHELKKQIYVFIEKPVHLEYRTWLANMESESFKPCQVDDLRVYKFIQEIYSYKSNNVISDFESVHDILEYLREQWAGLFQRFLQEESRKEEHKIAANLRATAETLAKIVAHMTKERDETIRAILVAGHPACHQLREAISAKFRTAFENEDELQALLAALGFSRIEPGWGEESENISFFRSAEGTKTTVSVLRDVFDEHGKLKPVEPTELNGRS